MSSRYHRTAQHKPAILKNLFDAAQYLQKHSVIPYIYAAIGCLQLSK